MTVNGHQVPKYFYHRITVKLIEDDVIGGRWSYEDGDTRRPTFYQPRKVVVQRRAETVEHLRLNHAIRMKLFHLVGWTM